MRRRSVAAAAAAVVVVVGLQRSQQAHIECAYVTMPASVAALARLFVANRNSQLAVHNSRITQSLTSELSLQCAAASKRSWLERVFIRIASVEL